MPTVAVNNHHFTKSIQGPLSAGAAVTPDDSNDLTYETRAIWVGVTGDVKVTMAQDLSVLTFKAMPVGLYMLAVTRIWASGTSATNMLALY